MKQIALEYISNLIAGGFESGYYPTWEIAFSGVDKNKIDECEIRRIADAVTDGFIGGEIIIDNRDLNNRSWWKLAV